ncbi:hypothetical protein [Terrimonas pollutisoli]|uniref:hypothetical protein n=1 Tax=Terrimonas pollutisoli TaxID=3034147 RepID=UPI0023EAA149|nr:hypothetical protein [Terrimonas sp. H1YJ31]
MNIHEAFQRGYFLYMVEGMLVYQYQHHEIHRELSKYLLPYVKGCKATLKIEIVDNDYLKIAIYVQGKEPLLSNNLGYKNKKLIEFINHSPKDQKIVRFF